jgi:antitoxin CptB
METGHDTHTSFNRLSWQCRRGMRELDELLGAFLVRRYATLDPRELHLFTRLLEYPDGVLLELLMGRMTPADQDVARLVASIRHATQA